MTTSTSERTGTRSADEPVAVPARVLRSTRITPSMVRVTLHGEELRACPALGRDHYFRLLLAPEGQERPVLPTTPRWWPEIQAMPEQERPVVRNYTVRATRPALGELDVDMVAHGDNGPASRWAASAAPGDEVGVIVQDTRFDPPAHIEHHLVVGDETALPAIGGIVESLPADARATVIVQVPTSADVQHLPAGPGVEISWRTPQDEGSLLEDVAACALPGSGVYAWVAGESAIATSVRRHLVTERGVPRDDIYFCGYWRACPEPTGD